MIKVKQMEFGLKKAPGRGVRPGSLRVRSSRSRWWFQKMHAVVDQAVDWKPRELRESAN